MTFTRLVTEQSGRGRHRGTVWPSSPRDEPAPTRRLTVRRRSKIFSSPNGFKIFKVPIPWAFAFDINDSYDLLNLWFPGQFRREDRFRIEETPTKPNAAFLNTEEAAEYLSISAETLRRLCRRKAITFRLRHQNTASPESI
jgi:hypothetical protein